MHGPARHEYLPPMNKILSVVFASLAFFVVLARGFQPGERVQLVAQNAAGVPVRDQPGDAQYYRWPDKTEGNVVAVQSRYLQVDAAGKRAWVHDKYAVSLSGPGDEGTEAPTLIIGAWNLEHMHDGEDRGFPELVGPRALPPRTPEDFSKIASAMRDHLGASVVMLSEIAGIPSQRSSIELDRLKVILGPSWKYVIGSSGGINGAQRVAILYDEARVEAISSGELVIPYTAEGGDDIFNRDPLFVHFRVKRTSGSPATDFIAAALHLASGQDKVANHNRAMERFRVELHDYCQSHGLANERDIIVGGDMNASRYDSRAENFWEGYDASGYGFTTLSPGDGDDYLATRLKGTPLFPGSQIDYLFASGQLLPRLA